MRWLRGIPLRVTLVAALVVMTAIGLLVSGIAVTSAIEQSLLNRTDRQLYEASQSWAKPRPERNLPPPGTAPGPDRPPSEFYVRIEDADGTVRTVVNDADNIPALPAEVGSAPITVDSLGDSDVQWRALSTSNVNGTTTVAIKLTENQEVVTRLVVLQSITGAVVLLALGIAAYFVIRGSLRPLREVEATAAAIAGGDLNRRVPERGTNTEVDHLSMALNGMLIQIEQAFAATEASEESARRSEEKMRRFVADASHELRTPLTTIRGFAELYRQGAAPDTDMVIGRIEGEASRMGLLVEDLLMLARLDAQRPIERKPVDLLALASDAVHNARAIAPERPISLDVSGNDATETLEVLGDRARLQQVLANLVGNTLMHTPTSAAVTVRLVPKPDEVIVEVVDTGPGLAPEDAGRVFERFYRTDSSRNRRSGGTGLGLSIVSALVAAHGGTVRVHSTPGVGTTFTVRLPRDAAERVAQRADQSGTLAP
ncbi:MAG TPA: HAMP domain-containing sensor histidine kinase [Aldersonia sp.]